MFSRNAFSKTAALCAAVAALATTAPALAVADDSVPTREVFTKDLDLSTPRDRARLESRLRGAARAVCGDAGRTGTRINSERTRCLADAMAQARSAAETRIAAATRTSAVGD